MSSIRPAEALSGPFSTSGSLSLRGTAQSFSPTPRTITPELVAVRRPATSRWMRTGM